MENQKKEYCLGIDCGTGGVRVGIFGNDGKIVVFESCAVVTAYPAVGMVE